jgi:hypothetical protein
MRNLLFFLLLIPLCTPLVAQFEDGPTGIFSAVELGPESTLPPAPTYVSDRPRVTDGEPAPELKTFITADVFPKQPAAGDQIWIEYGLPVGSVVAVELFDPRGYSYVLVYGGREAGVVVDALTIPPHLTPGTYYLKVKARNGRSIIPLTIE